MEFPSSATHCVRKITVNNSVLMEVLFLCGRMAPDGNKFCQQGVTQCCPVEETAHQAGVLKSGAGATQLGDGGSEKELLRKQH